MRLEVPIDQRLKLSAEVYAERRDTTVEQLIKDHLAFLASADSGLVVDSGRGLDPDLRKWALDYAQRQGTTVPQILIDHLQDLRREDSANDVPSV